MFFKSKKILFEIEIALLRQFAGTGSFVTIWIRENWKDWPGCGHVNLLYCYQTRVRWSL